MSDRASKILTEVLQLPPTERSGRLAELCGDDAALRRAVEGLLVTQALSVPGSDSGGGVLGGAQTASSDTPTIDSGPPVSQAGGVSQASGSKTTPPSVGSEQPGDRIGPYKLLQLIGEGGFGSVYMAEQTEPVHRRVALKIIKLGMDTKQVIARFEAERQALAMMDHPNIAKVLDAGATATGRPYFAMELVKGVAINEYCDGNSLTVRKRLELFIDVCHALQHAHQKGIIHRDLKPSNVLVTLHDTKAVPKVIDFGIAKATNQRLTEKTLFTEFRQFVGTPQYMSPEQAEMSGLDVDTRSDVYSLGVILYELLVGATPFDLETLLSGGYAEIPKIIREQDPPPLSTRFTSLGEKQTSIAKKRKTESSGLVQLLRGELDWIVGKAMEKDRTLRYESANEFAMDVQRYLESEPVSAAPRSALYRARKFVRRHRLGVLTGSAIAIALLIGLAGATGGLLKAKRELARSREMSDFLTELHIGFDPTQEERALSAEEIVERCQHLFGDDHVAVGSLLFARASILVTSGRLDEAGRVLDKCLEFQKVSVGEDHESVAATYQALGGMYEARGETQRARTAYEEALRIHRLCFGAESLQVGLTAQKLITLLITVGDPADEAVLRALFEEAETAFTSFLGEDDLKTVGLLCVKGSWLQTENAFEEAKPTLTEAVERGRAIRQKLGDRWLSALNSLTIVHMMQDENELAKGYYSELLNLIRERGVAGVALVTQLLRFGNWLETVDDQPAAEVAFRDALEGARAGLPMEHPMRSTAYQALASHLNKQGQNENLARLVREWVAEQREVLADDREAYAEAIEKILAWLRRVDQEALAEEIASEEGLPTNESTDDEG